ncbi:DNA gyrase subunit [Trichinella pseudospiralis]
MLRRSYSFQQTRPAFQRSRSLSISRSLSFVVNAPYTISHSDSAVFTRTPRSYLPFSSYKPFIAPAYGVVDRAPRHSDRYPHVRCSGYGEETNARIEHYHLYKHAETIPLNVELQTVKIMH